LLAVVYGYTRPGVYFRPCSARYSVYIRFSDNKKPGGATNSNRVCCLKGDVESN